MTLTLDWKKDQNKRWGNLLRSDLDHCASQNSEGVFIIWHGGSAPEIVCIGKGKILEKLKTLSKNADVLSFQGFSLYFAWAAATSENQDGIEVYLSQKLRPKINFQSASSAEPIAVNMPWKK